MQIHRLARFYNFLRDRDARVIELFFFALNIYILALVVLPPYSQTGRDLFWRIVFQLFVSGINLAALIQQSKKIRMTSAIANASIMALVATLLIRANNPNAGTYALLALLSAFICWKINIKQ